MKQVNHWQFLGWCQFCRENYPVGNPAVERRREKAHILHNDSGSEPGMIGPRVRTLAPTGNMHRCQSKICNR
jgi:hypothetical protein